MMYVGFLIEASMIVDPKGLVEHCAIFSAIDFVVYQVLIYKIPLSSVFC